MSADTESASYIPDDFAPGQPRELRRELWDEVVTDLTTEIAQAVGSELPLADTPPDFKRAWTLLARDRPEVAAENCTMRRRLIRRFFHRLVPLTTHTPSWSSP